MNLNRNPTIEELTQIIARVDDHEDAHILYVNNTGDVLITAVGEDNTPAIWAKNNTGNYQFRLESFHQGGGYLGEEAAKDQLFMKRIFYALTENWAKKTVGHVDDF